MDYQLVSPYTNTVQYCKIQIMPNQMNSDIENNMELVLKKKEKKCNKNGYVDKIYGIEEYEECILTPENLSGGAIFNIKYHCRLCLPLENTMIVSKVKNVNNEIILINGPIITIIPKVNIDTSVWELSNIITHKETKKELNPDDYVKIIIDKHKITQNDVRIITIGILVDYATQDEVENYFGSIVEKKPKEDNYIM